MKAHHTQSIRINALTHGAHLLGHPVIELLRFCRAEFEYHLAIPRRALLD
jgi:hypothetical protein